MVRDLLKECILAGEIGILTHSVQSEAHRQTLRTLAHSVQSKAQRQTLRAIHRRLLI